MCVCVACSGCVLKMKQRQRLSLLISKKGRENKKGEGERGCLSQRMNVEDMQVSVIPAITREATLVFIY